jgi:hypothetical protein
MAGSEPPWWLAVSDNAALQRGRQLQLVEAEHRQRQHDEDQGEAAEHPGVLQRSRQQRAGQAGGDADQRVGDGHAQHIGQRQHKGAQWLTA